MIGGGAPVVVQSMTNTNSEDIESTADQIVALAGSRIRAGAHYGQHSRSGQRLFPKSSKSSRTRKDPCRLSAIFITTVTCSCLNFRNARALLAKYRINPGNVGSRQKARRKFPQNHRVAIRKRQAGPDRRQLGIARPGAGWRALMDENSKATSQGRARKS